jgi:hypothetical protein
MSFLGMKHGRPAHKTLVFTISPLIDVLLFCFKPQPIMFLDTTFKHFTKQNEDAQILQQMTSSS